MTAPVLVTGGTGNLGRRVVPRLRAAGPDIRLLSRHPHDDAPGIRYVVGDTVKGVGLDEAMRGVDVVLHLAGGARGDDRAARHVARAAHDAGVGHLVLISVVGADRMPIGYFRAKAAAERATAESGVPFTILRAAQFHDFLHPVMRFLAATPIVLAPRGLRFEPVDVDAVAERLVDLTLGAPAGRVPDLTGPEVLDVEELARTWRAARGGRVRGTIRLPLAGAVGRAYRDGENLAAAGAVRAGRSWAESLA